MPSMPRASPKTGPPRPVFSTRNRVFRHARDGGEAGAIEASHEYHLQQPGVGGRIQVRSSHKQRIWLASFTDGRFFRENRCQFAIEGLGLLAGGPRLHGERVRAWDALRGAEALVEVCSPVFYDPQGERLRG